MLEVVRLRRRKRDFLTEGVVQETSVEDTVGEMTFLLLDTEAVGETRD